MRRRAFVGVLAALAAGGCGRDAEVLPRVGFVSPIAPGRRDASFRDGMARLGYVEGRNVALELRFGNGERARLRELVGELVHARVDVLVVGSTIGAQEAKAATSTIPIVFAGSSDPVAGGLVTSLARPGGNLTGLSFAYDAGVAGKWPELLNEIAPSVTHVAALWNPANAASARFVDAAEASARRLNVALARHAASNAAELAAALDAIHGSPAQGLIVMPSPFAGGAIDRLVAFAAQRRLPAMYFVEDFVEAGGLASYGPSIAESYGRAAAYVDRILKGAKPGDLPVEQPTTLDLVVHRGTARSLGLELPQSILVRARVVD